MVRTLVDLFLAAVTELTRMEIPKIRIESLPHPLELYRLSPGVLSHLVVPTRELPYALCRLDAELRSNSTLYSRECRYIMSCPRTPYRVIIWT